MSIETTEIDLTKKVTRYELWAQLERNGNRRLYVYREQDSDSGKILFEHGGELYFHDTFVLRDCNGQRSNWPQKINRDEAEKILRNRATELQRQIERLTSDMDAINQFFPS